MGTPSSGNPEVDALIAKLEAMIIRFEKVSTATKIGTEKANAFQVTKANMASI